MSDTTQTVRDLTTIARDTGPGGAPRVGRMAAGLIGSEILKIASEIRAQLAAGRQVCNLTVGDFSPAHFPIPERLRTGLQEALARGETNYPPSDGVLDLRRAVQRFYERELALSYPVEATLITGGSRPIIYGTYLAVCDPGDRVVYPVPSWNNNHYVHLVAAEGVAVRCTPEHRFMPTRDQLLPLLPGARVIALNSPLNPAGTVIDRATLGDICEAIVAENARRRGTGERPVYLLYDQVYWMLCFGETTHTAPSELVPEMARYTIYVDGISKAFAATGLRVGWAVGPVDVIERMSAILTHVGAWAPRAEQVATRGLLDDASGIRTYLATFKHGLQERLDRLHAGLQSLKAEGLPVDSIPPMGAIYLATRIHPFGRRTPEGSVLSSNEHVRKYLLEQAALAVVPFQAFGVPDDDGWFRLSVGAVGLDDIEAALPRLGDALRALA